MKNQLGSYLTWGLVLFCGTMIGLWYGTMQYEYRCVRQHLEELIRVREEYESYVLALKRLIGDCQKQIALDETSPVGEKKKLNSSDDRSDFLLVNRDNEYLKRSALLYAREHNLQDAVEKLYQADDFVAKSQHMGKRQARFVKSTKKRHIKQPASRAEELPPSWWEQLKREPIFISPIAKGDFWISSRFGPRKKPDGSWGFHHAVDMAAVRGTPVRAAGEGVVIEAGYSPGYGNMVIIAHNRKFKTRYAHLEKILTSVGAKVTTNTIIGKVGDTGSVRKRGKDASHLHFEVLVFGKRANPLYFIV